MSDLTSDECEALGDWWDASDEPGWGLATLIPVVANLIEQRAAGVVNPNASEVVDDNCPGCGSRLDGDNFCMVSACQWEGL